MHADKNKTDCLHIIGTKIFMNSNIFKNPKFSSDQKQVLTEKQESLFVHFQWQMDSGSNVVGTQWCNNLNLWVNMILNLDTYGSLICILN